MEAFLDELEKPAEAYRGRYPYQIYRILFDEIFYVVNLLDVRKGLSELRDGLARIHQELIDYFADLSDNDRYGRQMWAFYNRASIQLEDLVDDVRNADSTFVDAINYYGEEDKNMSSSEFYGIFKTFVTSYKVCLSIDCIVQSDSCHLSEM